MTSEYKCPTCGVNDPNAYNSCNHPACPDGRDIGNRRETRAVPDVPELVTVAWKHPRTEYVSHKKSNISNHCWIGRDEPVDLVTRDQAAEIIAAKDKEIEKLICALSACQKALDSLVSEESIKNTTVFNAYAMCVDAELKARKALKGESNV